jgi:hypothetical protein
MGLPPPPGWDTDLWLMFRGGCVVEGLRDPDDLRRERAAYEAEERAAYEAAQEPAPAKEGTDG